MVLASMTMLGGVSIRSLLNYKTFCSSWYFVCENYKTFCSYGRGAKNYKTFVVMKNYKTIVVSKTTKQL